MSQSIDMDAVIAELRKPNGWMKGDLGSFTASDGPVCLRGAMFRTATKAGLDHEVVTRLERELIDRIILEQYGERVASDFGAVPRFNDHPDTTLGDVLLVCEKARAEQ
jgi:hypothetical protein